MTDDKFDHLFVMVHGNHGTPKDLETVAKTISRIKGINPLFVSKIEVIIKLFSKDNDNTHLGIEFGGKVLAKEIKDFLDTNKITYKINFSMIGHSLGGLYSRNALKWIYLDKEMMDLFNFCTYTSICTPHLGSRRPGGNYYNLGKNIWRFAVGTYLSIIGDTGSELNLSDQDQILLKMSKDKEYIEPLNLFKSRTLIALAHYDMSVPFGSSSIRSSNPYPPPSFSTPKFSVLGVSGFQKEVVEKIFQDVKEQKFDDSYLGEDNGSNFYCDDVKHVEYPLDLYKNLNQIEWRRVDIEFQVDSYRRIFALHDLVVCKESKTAFLLTDEVQKIGMDFQDKLYEIFDHDLNN